MNRLKKLILRCLDAVIRSQWKRDFHNEIRSDKKNKVSQLPRFNEKQLFLVPHADDDLLGGYALAQLQADSIMLGYYGLTGSDVSPENKKVRDNEFQNYTKEANLKKVTIYDIETLRCITKENKIKIFFLPSIVDWHPEHRKLNYDLYDALFHDSENDINGYRILWYCISVPIVCEDMYIVPMTEKKQSEKYDMFQQIYHSQAHMPLRRFQYEECISGHYGGCHSGESFLEISVREWKEIVETLRKEEPDRGNIVRFNLLKKEINSIRRIRETSKSLYKLLLKDKGQ